MCVCVVAEVVYVFFAKHVSASFRLAEGGVGEITLHLSTNDENFVEVVFFQFFLHAFAYKLFIHF